eukprot:CAMPEP_0181168528 /NCGR_PEP_ID=MMETSP1096-20121128/325_1 /TAXON_ID=156174 ORGANISM="Chrysochromulina ericina, Strain CCMP281" /NCGR_SAMPLE_ID=MMETSP1096 /ASSEMBLY_ACC=CAM_ASM_000453 /LENGTH=113 /DNA_ID=CAMNT_0023255917 /DNA_START=147 /DNA_END=488 /DNA_ORIENTATION=+
MKQLEATQHTISMEHAAILDTATSSTCTICIHVVQAVLRRISVTPAWARMMACQRHAAHSYRKYQHAAYLPAAQCLPGGLAADESHRRLETLDLRESFACTRPVQRIQAPCLL